MTDKLRIPPKDRAKYLKAQGYDVRVRVTYERVRKARGLSPEQAADFAVAREAEFSDRYLGGVAHLGHSICSVEAVSINPASERGKADAAPAGAEGDGKDETP